MKNLCTIILSVGFFVLTACQSDKTEEKFRQFMTEIYNVSSENISDIKVEKKEGNYQKWMIQEIIGEEAEKNITDSINMFMDIIRQTPPPMDINATTSYLQLENQCLQEATEWIEETNRRNGFRNQLRSFITDNIKPEIGEAIPYEIHFKVKGIPNDNVIIMFRNGETYLFGPQIDDGIDFNDERFVNTYIFGLMSDYIAGRGTLNRMQRLINTYGRR